MKIDHYCKFGSYCKFLHKENEDKAIEAIENQLKDVKKELEEKEKAINELTENILQMEENKRNEIKLLWDKNEINEKDLQFLKAENENLKERLDVKESEFKLFKEEINEWLSEELGRKEDLIGTQEVLVEEVMDKGTHVTIKHKTVSLKGYRKIN